MVTMNFSLCKQEVPHNLCALALFTNTGNTSIMGKPIFVLHFINEIMYAGNIMLLRILITLPKFAIIGVKDDGIKFFNQSKQILQRLQILP